MILQGAATLNDCPISTVSHQVESQTSSGVGGGGGTGTGTGNMSGLMENTHNNSNQTTQSNQVASRSLTSTTHNNQNLSVTISGGGDSGGSSSGCGNSGHTTSNIAIASSQMSTPVHPQHQAGSSSSRGQPGSAMAQVTKRKETLEAKRERKAAKTLAIITGAFVVCWLPFFLMALLLPLCEDCHINDWIASLFLWLGYFNSTLNPVIYTIFSPEFRQAFKRILFGSNSRTSYYRRGKL